MSFWKSLSKGFIADSLTEKNVSLDFGKTSSSRIIVNGQVYTGTNVNVVNGKVIIDGKDMTPESKTINIVVEGNIEKLDVDACSMITVNGQVGELESGAGDVKCGDVAGPVRTGSGDVQCGNVEGNVQTGSGDVIANTIKGTVKTGSGDINYKNR